MRPMNATSMRAAAKPAKVTPEPAPAAFGLHRARPVDPGTIAAGMDIARVTSTVTGQRTETLRVHEVTDDAFVAARGATIARDLAAATWFVLAEPDTTIAQLCSGCGGEVTAVHLYTHADPVHVETESRWCTTETGPAWPDRRASRTVAVQHDHADTRQAS